MTDAVLAHNYQALVEVVKSGNAGKRGEEILSEGSHVMEFIKHWMKGIWRLEP